MNIAKIFLTTALLSSAAMVNAAESALRTDVNISDFCVYEEKLYSPGAIVQVGDVYIQCYRAGGRWVWQRT